MARDVEDVKYRGRRRWNGSHGRVWWDGELLFEIAKFEAKVTADREDVLIGNSKDSKITSLTGEGSFTIKSVINRNINRYLEEWKNGHDPRATLTGLIDDPDAVEGQKERCILDNVWFNEHIAKQHNKRLPHKNVRKPFLMRFSALKGDIVRLYPASAFRRVLWYVNPLDDTVPERTPPFLRECIIDGTETAVKDRLILLYR